SLQDDLMRIFPVQGMDNMLVKLGLEEGESITHPWVTKAIERAQAKVEGRNFDIRKNILKYDDVMNDQRKVIFEQRLELMDDENVSETIDQMRHDMVDDIMSRHIPDRSYPEQWEGEALQEAAKTYLNVELPIAEWQHEDHIDEEMVRERLIKAADEVVAAKAAQYSPDIMRQVEKQILLNSVDGLWREHLVTLDHLSKVVGWRGLAQRDPLNEYKQEAYELFQKMLDSMRELVTAQIAHVNIQIQPPQPQQPPAQMFPQHLDPLTGENEVIDAIDDGGDKDYSKVQLTDEQLRKTRRNEPCPCGSGKKFKHCHGAFQRA
ncbi:MAG: SEC-C domain-containing protein, partial [Hyphomicrobiaceae bacterium]|nr:SEC-C domain-containing protein [Hyphomicrobiaceae bacterium]